MSNTKVVRIPTVKYRDHLKKVVRQKPTHLTPDQIEGLEEMYDRTQDQVKHGIDYVTTTVDFCELIGYQLEPTFTRPPQIC